MQIKYTLEIEEKVYIFKNNYYINTEGFFPFRYY